MNKGYFSKGNIPWNKGKKGIHLSPSSEFKKGSNVGWKGGIQNIKSDCIYLWDGCNRRVRRPRKVYEEHHGAIDKSLVIYHIDGDHHNDDISNLEAITRAELIKRNRQMGMFDDVKAPAMPCKNCGNILTKQQSKDAECICDLIEQLQSTKSNMTKDEYNEHINGEIK